MIVCAVSIFIVVSLQSAEKEPTKLVTIDEQFIEAYKKKRKDVHRALAAQVAETTQAAEKAQKELPNLTSYLKQLEEQIDSNNQSLEGLTIRLGQLRNQELTIMITGILMAELPTIRQDCEKLFEDISRLKEENEQLYRSKTLVRRAIEKYLY